LLKCRNTKDSTFCYFSIIALVVTIGVVTTESTITLQANAFDQAKNYTLINKVGSEGEADGQFGRPHGLDFDPTEKYLYVIDRDGDRVQVFDKNGKFLFKWGSEGEGDGQFNYPDSLDVDSQGNVWVVDKNNHRIQKFDTQGNFLLKFGSLGEGEGEFDNPRQVVIDKDIKYAYVVDSENHRIQKFDTQGNFIKSWGTEGRGDGQFDVPISAAIDSKGNIIVKDTGTARVQKFDVDGNFLMKFGTIVNGGAQLTETSSESPLHEHLATDKYDNIYINFVQNNDSNNGTAGVQKFTPDGNFLSKWGEGQVNDPEHVAITSNGTAYVSDRGSHDIKVFKPVDGNH
jgi:tripartite motif-containing protein 71